MSEIVNSSLKTVVKGAFHVFFGTAGSFFVGFLLKLLIVRNTTKEEFGIYTLSVAIVSIISFISCLGLQEGTPRYIAILLGEGKRGDVRGMSRASVNLGIISGVTVFLFLFFFSGVVSKHIFYKPELEMPLMVISFFVPFFVMAQVIVGIFRGHNMIKPKVYYLDIGFPLFSLVLISICILLRLPFISLVYSYVLAMVIVSIVIGINGYRKIGIKSLSAGKPANTGKLLLFSIPILTSSLMVLIFNWTDTLMLGRYGNTEAVGLYNISITLANFLTFPVSAFGFVFMPIAADMYARGQDAELKRTYQVLAKWFFSVTLPLFFVFFWFPEMTISFLFGKSFVNSSNPLRILSIGFLVQSFLGVSGHLMVVKGLSKTLMKISIMGAFLNVVMNYIFIKQLNYGIIGASLATMISYSIIPMVCAIVIYKEMSIHPITSGYLKPAAGAVIIGLIIYVIAKALPLHLWMLPVYLFLFIGGYIFSLFITSSIEKEDVVLFKSILKRSGLEMEAMRRFIHKFAFK